MEEELIFLIRINISLNILLTKTDVIDFGGSNMVHGIEKDRFENLWLATYGSGLINYDLLTGKITQPLKDAKIDQDEYVFSLLIDYSERLWVGIVTELIILDVSTKKSFDTKIYY